MTDTATAAPASTAAPAATEAPASVAGAALFGAPDAASKDTSTAAPAGTDAPATLTPEEQAAKDAADAEAAKNEPPALKMPGKDATPEEWSAFYASIGRPETPEGYELPVPDGDDGTFAKQMAPVLHKHGVTAEQAKGLAADWNAMQAAAAEQAAKAEQDQITAMDSKNKAEHAELSNEWGTNATANMEFAKRGVTQFIEGDQAQQQKVIAAMEKELGYKATIKFFHGIGKAIGEHDAAGLGQQNSGAPQKSLAERLYGGSSK